MVKIYKQPFAHGGDTIAIPDASQPDGKISNSDGWTPDYQLLKTDPNYKPVGRQEMNGVFKEVTESLGELQQFGFAKWQPMQWPQDARVVEGGVVYRALNQTSQQPPHADWVSDMDALTLGFGTAATRDVGESSGNVMEVGAFGLGSTALFLNPKTELGGSGFFAVTSSTVNNPVGGDAVAINGTWAGDGAGVAEQTLYISTSVPVKGWLQNRYGIQANYSDAEILTTGNILTTTGQSTEYPMTQKAVTDAINNSAIGVGQTYRDRTLERAKATVYTNSDAKPRLVILSMLAESSSEDIFIYVDGEKVVEVGNVAGGDGHTHTFIVQAGLTYKIDMSRGSIVKWMELSE